MQTDSHRLGQPHAHKGRMESMLVCTVLSLIDSCQPQRQSPIPYIVDSTVVLSTMTLLGMLKPTQNACKEAINTESA